MNVGWIGLGKLGLPCAMVLGYYGKHQMYGYDVSETPGLILRGLAEPPREKDLNVLLADESARPVMCDSISDVVTASDVVFVAVQTPHEPRYGGETPAPAQRRDFEYQFLVQACRGVCQAAVRHRRRVSLVIVSTVLPGTCNHLIRPLLNPYVTLIYSPAFIAMGTTIADYLNPEFVTCGVDRLEDSRALRRVFEPVHRKDLLSVTSIETAEMIKVTYNIAISSKIVLANTIMEICHKTGADCDKVIDALSLATDRVISARYLRGGMGDAGGCHPRDAIAMSWLAERLELSYDLPGEIIRARESQSRWLADLAVGYSDQTGLPIALLGKAYKPGSNLTLGSAAFLLAHQLGERVHTHWDPHVDEANGSEINLHPFVVVVTTRHDEFTMMNFAPGSVVIDPFGFIGDQTGITVVRVGRK